MNNKKYIASITPENNSLVIDVQKLYNLDTDVEFVYPYIVGGNINTKLYINGIQFQNNNDKLKNYAKPFIFNFRIEPIQGEEFFSESIEIEFKDNSGNKCGGLTIYISDGDVQKLQNYSNEQQNTKSSLNSFMMIRTNPKLTGNIKVVVDSEGNLFMDTFKASSVLNNRVYRKYPISSEGNYPHDVKTVFSKLPLSELYKTPDDSLNPHKFYKDQSKQYITEYEYGAQTNMDDLYSENMSILAPLHIGKNVPDFFCIFRYDEIYNKETYHSKDFNDMDKFTNMLKKSSVVKIFDLRSYTAAGQYIRNYAKSINNIIHGSCYLQFIEQDNDKNSENYRQGQNSWKGIDVSRGIITNKIESSYFANNILVSDDAVQERFNNYIINGYERNNVLYPYILNLQYMFNDEQSEEFSMHRYFGLYLTSNEFLQYQCIITDYNNGNEVVRKLDNNDNAVKDNEIFNSIFTKKYEDRIIFMVTNDKAERVRSSKDVKQFINDNVLDNPDGNIADVKSDEMIWKDEHKSFITLSFDKPLKYGEHLRFSGFNVYNESKSVYENICLEIIASNDERLLETDNFIYPYITTNTSDVFVHNDEEQNESEPEVTNNFYRLSFYTQSLTDKTVAASVPEQIERICACIKKFNSFITVTNTTEDSIGIVSTEENVYFQHIAVPENVEQIKLQKIYFNANKIEYVSLSGPQFPLTTTDYQNMYSWDLLNENTYLYYEVEAGGKLFGYIQCSLNGVNYNIDIIAINSSNQINLDYVNLPDELRYYLSSLWINRPSTSGHGQIQIQTGNSLIIKNLFLYVDPNVIKPVENNNIYYSAKKDYESETFDSYLNVIKKELIKNGVNYSIRRDNTSYELENESYYTKVNVSGDVVSNFVEYMNPDNTIVDNIHYFSRVHDTVMRPLSPDTKNYDKVYSIFSLYGFEGLGWRYSNIIPFKRPSEFKNPFVVYDNLQEILKNIKHPLVKVSDKKFESMLLMNVDNDYLTDNVLLNLNLENHIHTQNIMSVKSERHTILSPYNLNGCIIDFYNRPFVHNYTISIFNSESAQISVMGILGIKDIDMSINLSHDNEIVNKQYVELAKDTQIDITGEDNIIHKDILYVVDKGSFKEINVKKFIICGNQIYYTTDENTSNSNQSSVSYMLFYGNVLTVSSDMILRMLDGGNHQEFHYKNTEPIQSDDNFFTYRDQKATSKFDIPVVPMTNCFWKSNGLYLDGTSVLNVDNIVNKYDKVGYFTEHSMSPAVDDTKNMFIVNTPNSFLTTDDNLFKFKNVIIDGSIKNVIKKMIYRNSNIDTAIGYYNSYIQSLEFIYYGIKFNLKFNSEYYNQNLRIGEYNNFDVFFINDYDPMIDNELYISADEEFILFVNHKFNLLPLFEKYTKVNEIGSNYISEGVDYSVSKAPYKIYTDTICGYRSNIVVSKNNEISVLKDSENTWFVQEDYVSEKLYDNQIIRSHYLYMPVKDDASKTFNVDALSNDVGILRTDRNGSYIIDNFSNSNNLKQNDTLNYQDRISSSFLLNYLNDNQESIDERDIEEKVNEYIKSFDNNLNCYVIYNGVVSSMTITDSYKPLNITMKTPNKIKFNFGYFTPVFYDVMEFHMNDFELAESANVSLLMANTKVKSVKRLNTYTENKVFESTSEFDVYKNYFFDYNRSVFSTNWDNKFYRKYSENDSYELKCGYFSGIEDKTFFGSKCLVIKGDYITIDDFSSIRINPKVEYLNSSYNVYSDNKKQCRITINITQSIYALFDNDETFKSNWKNNEGWSDVETSRANYIQNTITNIFNTQRKREVVLYGFNNSTQTMDVQFESNESGYNDWKVIEDFDVDTRIENDDMVLIITISMERGLTVHPQLKIYKY